MALEGTRGIYALTLSDRADLLEEFKKNSMISSVLMAVVAHSGQAGVVAEGSRALDKLCPTAMCSFRMMGGLNILLPEVYWREYTHYEPIDLEVDYPKLMFRDSLEMMDDRFPFSSLKEAGRTFQNVASEHAVEMMHGFLKEGLMGLRQPGGENFHPEDVEAFSTVLGYFAWYKTQLAEVLSNLGCVTTLMRWLRANAIQQTNCVPAKRAVVCSLAYLCKSSQAMASELATSKHGIPTLLDGANLALDAGVRRCSLRCIGYIAAYGDALFAQVTKHREELVLTLQAGVKDDDMYVRENACAVL